MPVVKGLEFIESLLGKGCRCQHIALLSGFYDDDDLARAAKLGCKVIAKPFMISEITDWLDTMEESLAVKRCCDD